MKTSSVIMFQALLILFFAVSCNNGGKTENGKDTHEQSEIIKKVSYYSDETTIAATYFSEDTNWTALAKALWKEKTKLLEGKDSSVIYYLIVFNNLAQTPDITADYNIVWNPEYNHSRSCTLDNGLTFMRFCYGIRYDMGRVGDWAHIRYVNQDGSLTEEQ